MARTIAGSVFRCDTDNDTVPGPVHVCGIKYIAGGSGTAIIVRAGDSNGAILYECDASADVFEDVEFRCQEGLHIDLAGTGTVVYIYTEV